MNYDAAKIGTVYPVSENDIQSKGNMSDPAVRLHWRLAGIMAEGRPLLLSICFLSALAVYWLTSSGDSPFIEQTCQASGWLHGHSWLDCDPHIVESVTLNGHPYSLHPPLPAMLMVPLVALRGISSSFQIYVSLVLGALGVTCVVRLMRELRLSWYESVWMAGFLAFGTIFWHEAALGDTWALPEVTAVLFTVLTLTELYGRARPFWLGLWLSCAFLSRYELGLTIPLILGLTYRRRKRTWDLSWALPPLVLALGFFTAFNWVRFHSFFDLGVSIEGRLGHNPVFGLCYLPGNLYTLFFMPPVLRGRFPYLLPSIGGQAITYTSPAFAIALAAELTLENCLFWAAALLVALPSLICYANGLSQFGARHYVQCYPFLLLLMGKALTQFDGAGFRLTHRLIVVSLLWIAWCTYVIHVYGLVWS
jgi:hypothetical protein